MIPLIKGINEPIQKNHLQRNKNTTRQKQIKAAFTLPRLNKAAQRVATVIANGPPRSNASLSWASPRSSKQKPPQQWSVKAKDQLKAVLGKTKAKKVKDNTSKYPGEQGHPPPPPRNLPPRNLPPRYLPARNLPMIKIQATTIPRMPKARKSKRNAVFI
jgi:hypothetical protein